ncbi:helix-turn-helix domain-containing protein [Chryseolinea sp. H1M3-3]|uniref:helix-turn-helix domain-containing protein n=1 Tax=Chryseolinea sp. H1M3-3 TaxID=3034144 RepID=UPI0023ED503B|nr:helix-turn-helix domain-containing protein [Chryseolinea sp. H1M3-3]
MTIQKFQPSAVLAPFVSALIIIESELEALNKTIPDTTMVMSFRYKGNVMRMEGERPETLFSSNVAGIRKTVRHFHYDNNTGNLLVIFKAGGFNAFSGIPAHELFGLNVEAGNFFQPTELDEILERLHAAPSNDVRVQIIESILTNRLIIRKPDLMVKKAIQIIQSHIGMIRIKDLAATLSSSQDSFEKRFRAQVGCSPKQFASIVRLRNVINNFQSFSSLTELAYAAGYFDQSHFIKDFRLFTGQAPKDFFKSSGYW